MGYPHRSYSALHFQCHKTQIFIIIPAFIYVIAGLASILRPLSLSSRQSFHTSSVLFAHIHTQYTSKFPPALAHTLTFGQSEAFSLPQVELWTFAKTYPNRVLQTCTMSELVLSKTWTQNWRLHSSQVSTKPPDYRTHTRFYQFLKKLKV